MNYNQMDKITIMYSGNFGNTHSFLEILDVIINQPDETYYTDDNMLGIDIVYRFLPTDDLDTLTINLSQTNY